MERWRVEELLDRIADGDDEALDQLTAYINSQPEGIRLLAFEALRYGGDDTREQLLLTLGDVPGETLRPAAQNTPLPEDADLSDLHPIAQQAGSEWQARVGPREAPPELLEQLKSNKRGERIRAARALGEYRAAASVPPLIEAMKSGDRQVAAAAVQSLQEIGSVAVPALTEALSDQDEQTRWNAARALSITGDERSVPALIRTLNDRNYGTRWLAAEALARIGQPTIVPLLRRLAEEKSSTWLRQGAWHVFNKINLPQEEARVHFKSLGAQIRRGSAGTVASLARQELKRQEGTS